MPFEYAPEALEVLIGHGLRPGPATPPAVVRDGLNDLYRYEIRRLKAKLLADEFPKHEYIDRVIEMRRRYWLLSVPIERWVRESKSASIARLNLSGGLMADERNSQADDMLTRSAELVGSAAGTAVNTASQAAAAAARLGSQVADAASSTTTSVVSAAEKVGERSAPVRRAVTRTAKRAVKAARRGAKVAARRASKVAGRGRSRTAAKKASKSKRGASARRAHGAKKTKKAKSAKKRKGAAKRR